ncbi:MAG: NAD(P)-dependent alcohol dehydrogenase [Hyphomicrobiales bacterium]|nr:MAG: NAD(P)-dependent alcohol dehydrogenase [Hyphomicrobiales bacterium]
MADSIALVLEKQHELSIRNIELPSEMGESDVRISIDTVGVCGSDVHYYTHGRIGPFIVEEPMVLGHEAAGTITHIGRKVTGLKVGDRVCMEPGIPDANSKASKLGLYNVDPSVVFWATPPVHGCLTPEVVHPAAYTYKLPDNVSFAEGAMVEPFAVGMQAVSKAKISPGDVGLVIGAGPIGTMTALAALAGGCSKVYVTDVVQEKLDVLSHYPGITGVLSKGDDLARRIALDTDGWGADVVFECAGHSSVYATIFDQVCPGGCVVFVGMPVGPIELNIVAAQAKEIRMETVFRYANVYPRAIDLIGSGKVDLKPLISATFPFSESIAAFDRAVLAKPQDVKIQIKMP